VLGELTGESRESLGTACRPDRFATVPA
jgi:hypothetical protein